MIVVLFFRWLWYYLWYIVVIVVLLRLVFYIYCDIVFVCGFVVIVERYFVWGGRLYDCVMFFYVRCFIFVRGRCDS